MAILGIDYLAASNYPDVVIKHHPPGWAAGFLLRASGWKSPLPTIRKLFETGHCPGSRIHGLWKDKHDFTERDITPAVKRAEAVARLAEDFPRIELYFSPWLEPGTRERPIPVLLLKKVKSECRKVLPRRVKIVVPGTPKGIDEIHGPAALIASSVSKKYIFSWDGNDMLDPHYPKIEFGPDDPLICFAWTVKCNGLKNETDTTLRQNRKNWLRAEDVRLIVEAMR